MESKLMPCCVMCGAEYKDNGMWLCDNCYEKWKRTPTAQDKQALRDEHIDQQNRERKEKEYADDHK